jgi:uracil-DNA glycosylase
MDRTAAWNALAEQAASCTRCDLYRDATRAVFGEGPADARLLMIGEAPGDQEDRQGRPFVGPAGQLLDRAMAEAGLARNSVYLTNAVKHFKFTPRGKRRIHQKPDAGEIEACKFWLLQELDLVHPRLILALGATAAQALLGRSVTIARTRGRFQPYPPDAEIAVTVHPSYLLRLPEPRLKEVEYARFVDDLRLAARRLDAPASAEEAASARQGRLSLP